MVSSEIRDQFDKDNLVESMSIIHLYFQSIDCSFMNSIYKKYVGNLMKHFYRHVDINRLNILGILEKNKLSDQSHQFTISMYEEYKQLNKPIENGSIV